jgi:hypothetical protein
MVVALDDDLLQIGVRDEAGFFHSLDDVFSVSDLAELAARRGGRR